MATTRIMPLHVGKGRTESRAISDIIDYVANPQKTDGGKLITGFACDSRVADAEFMLAKRQYIAATGRVRGADDVIAYHVRQSFKPGEITPEEANRLGVEFAKRFTKGNHAFVVCTHIDKAHVHNHIIWSSINLDCDRKFRNFWGSTKAVRRLSDTICIENGYSIVADPKRHGKSYNKWLGEQAKPSHRELLRAAIDDALAKKPADLDALLRSVQAWKILPFEAPWLGQGGPPGQPGDRLHAGGPAGRPCWSKGAYAPAEAGQASRSAEGQSAN